MRKINQGSRAAANERLSDQGEKQHSLPPQCLIESRDVLTAAHGFGLEEERSINRGQLVVHIGEQAFFFSQQEDG